MKGCCGMRIAACIGFLLNAQLTLHSGNACAGEDLAARTDLVPGYAIDLGGSGTTGQTFSASAGHVPNAGVTVVQQGDSNRAQAESGPLDGVALSQSGNNNQASIHQTGIGNAAALTQVGSDNSISATQGGNSLLRVEQSGSRITADVMQGANAPPLTIRQTGGGTYAKVLQY